MLGDSDPWWEVNLLDSYPISQINIYSRTDCCMDRLKDMTVTILDGGDEMWSYGQGGTTPPSKLVLDISGSLGNFVVGNKVRVSVPPVDGNAISLAEVEVLRYTSPVTNLALG